MRRVRFGIVPEVLATAGFLVFISGQVGDILLGENQVLVYGLDKYAVWLVLALVGIAMGVAGFSLAFTRTSDAAACGFHATALVLLVALALLFVGLFLFLLPVRFVTVPVGDGRQVVLRETSNFLADYTTEVYVRRGVVLENVGYVRAGIDESNYAVSARGESLTMSFEVLGAVEVITYSFAP